MSSAKDNQLEEWLVEAIRNSDIATSQELKLVRMRYLELERRLAIYERATSEFEAFAVANKNGEWKAALFTQDTSLEVEGFETPEEALSYALKQIDENTDVSQQG